jgi:hypothetical protein
VLAVTTNRLVQSHAQKRATATAAIGMSASQRAVMRAASFCMELCSLRSWRPRRQVIEWIEPSGLVGRDDGGGGAAARGRKRAARDGGA